MEKQKGITLVSLVITIIVLLIIAGVIISIAIDSDGLFSKAEEAVSKWNDAVNKEEEAVQNALNKLKENRLPEEEETPDEEEIPEIVTANPNITLSTSVADMTITATVTLNNGSEVATPVTYNYYIKKSTETEYSLSATKTETTHNFTTTEAATYNVKVVATSSDNKTGSDTKDATVETVCFVAGTKVLTEEGFKNIEDIVVGEKVYSLNTANNQKELREVTNTMISTSTEIYKLKIGDKLVEATPKHRFYVVDKGWIRARELEVGDKIVAKDDSSLEVTIIELVKYEEPIRVYNLTVEGTHTYLITDLELLVHNASPKEEEII